MSDGGFGHQHVPRNQRRLRSILALDKQIIQLKRSRNSLLNVTRIPPEVLGHIFHFNVKPKASDGPFAGLGERSHNFLRVCHHWSEVSRRTPELWSFWGNSLEDWERQCPHSGPYLLDLVLDRVEHRDGGFDGGLQDVLRDCAGRGAIRKVHLRDDDVQLLTDIISTLTPGRWYPRQQYRINRSGTCGCSPFPPPPPSNNWCGCFRFLLPTPFPKFKRPLPLRAFHDLVVGLGLPEITYHGPHQPFPLLRPTLIHSNNVTNTFTPRLKP
jgi:hypothetical protein